MRFSGQSNYSHTLVLPRHRSIFFDLDDLFQVSLMSTQHWHNINCPHQCYTVTQILHHNPVNEITHYNYHSFISLATKSDRIMKDFCTQNEAF